MIRQHATPAAIAEALGVNTDKVLTWIHRGELRAVNVAVSTVGRPRWRIALEDAEAFMRRRTTGPAMRVTRRRRKVAGEYPDYF